MKQLQAVIFDFNGVLWWDSNLQKLAWGKFAQKIGRKSFNDHEMDIHVHGRNNKHAIQYLIGCEVTGQKLDNLIQEKESIYRKSCLQEKKNFKLSPGSIKFFEFLVKKKIPFTIATASEKTNLDFFIKYLDLTKWFDIQKIVYDNGMIRGKPFPDVYLQAAKNLEKDPINCIVFEDSISGVLAAKEANIGKIIGICPLEKQKELKQNGAVEIIQSFVELEKDQLFS